MAAGQEAECGGEDGDELVHVVLSAGSRPAPEARAIRSESLLIPSLCTLDGPVRTPLGHALCPSSLSPPTSNWSLWPTRRPTVCNAIMPLRSLAPMPPLRATLAYTRGRLERGTSSFHDAARGMQKNPAEAGFSECAESQNRTGDTRFFRPVLYRLSYLGATNPGSAVPFASLPVSGGRGGGATGSRRARPRRPATRARSRAPRRPPGRRRASRCPGAARCCRSRSPAPTWPR